MKLRVLILTMALSLASMVTATYAYAAPPASKDIQAELMCQCGCTMVVNVCDCETANQVRAKIDELIGQGQNKEQIVGYFVSRYGEKMLAYPSKQGFNLLAWIAPFAAVAAGGTGLFFILRAWTRKGRREAAREVVSVKPASRRESEAYRDRLEDELRKFRDEGRR